MRGSGAVLGRVGLALGVIRAADERPRLDVVEAEPASDLRQLGELVGVVVLLDRQVARRGSQVLAERQDRDIDRFGAGLPRFSPRQADVLFVVGTISHKMAPVLKRVYDQMTEPKWVVAFGVCTCTGGFYDNYATVMGIDTIIPVDIYIPGCPPRPESVIDGLMKLQDKIAAQAQRY